MTAQPRSIRGLVAAAGAGRRFHAGQPKQYADLNGRPMLAHAIERVGADERVRTVMVVLAPDDERWASFDLRFPFEVLIATGGESRGQSVANGLRTLLANGAAPEDLVLVHDAARPCLHREDLSRLIDVGLAHPGGALLAAPVHDTLKRAVESQSDGAPPVEATVPRERIWRALTPQMFPLGSLLTALEEAFARGEGVTDESGAMEAWAARHGHPPPRLVEAKFENPKVTRPADLELARRCLALEAAEEGAERT